MTSFTTVRPILDFPLNDFPNVPGRYGDLYDLRGTCTHSDGFFLVKCDAGDHIEASFPLMGGNAGSYLLGQIIPCKSRSIPDKVYYEVFIHGGMVEATRFCETASELAEVLRLLEQRGPEYILGDPSWEATEDSPFDTLFSEFPNDLRFVLLFGPHAITGEDPILGVKK